MNTRSEINRIFRTAFQQRAPRWVHNIDCNITRVCLLIEYYDRRIHCSAITGGSTYIRAIPRDCAYMIFGHLRYTRWYVNHLLREFVGRAPRKYPSEGSGIAGRPDPKGYAVTINRRYNIFYGIELVFTCKPGAYFAFYTCGYYHSNGIVLSGRSAELFNELWAGAVALAGPMIVPQRLQYEGRQYYLLEYYCRGHFLASTQIIPGRVITQYALPFCTVDGIYSAEFLSPECKQQLFKEPLQ